MLFIPICKLPVGMQCTSNDKPHILLDSCYKQNHLFVFFHKRYEQSSYVWLCEFHRMAYISLNIQIIMYKGLDSQNINVHKWILIKFGGWLTFNIICPSGLWQPWSWLPDFTSIMLSLFSPGWFQVLKVLSCKQGFFSQVFQIEQSCSKYLI